jgi:uncharacterized protein YciI
MPREDPVVTREGYSADVRAECAAWVVLVKVPAVPELLQVLHYEYVPDIVERRKEHREAHLGLISRYHGDDRVVIAGAVGDPPHGAMIVFRDAADAEAFAGEDPYVAAGLVTRWRVEPWTVVT